MGSINDMKVFSLKLKGKISMFHFNLERAIQYYENAMALNPNSIETLKDLQAVCQIALKWDRFFELYEEALARWPKKVHNKLNCGIAYMHLSRYKEAVPYLEDYIQSQLKSGNHFYPNVFAKLGICYAYLGYWDLAEVTLAKAENEYPWDVDMIFGWMCVLYGTNRTEDILGYLETKIKRYPRMYPLLYWKADYTRNILRQPTKSIEIYQSALDVVNFLLYKRNYEPYYFVVNTYCDLATVVDDYLSVLSETGKLKKTTSYRTWWWLGFGFVNRVTIIAKEILDGDYQLAKKECIRLLGKRMSPNMRAMVLSHLAIAQLSLGEFDQALASSIEAATLDSENFFSLDKLGSIYLKLGQWEDAKRIYQKLTNAEPFDPFFFEKLGTALENIGDIENAKSVYEKALQLNPNNLSIQRKIRGGGA